MPLGPAILNRTDVLIAGPYRQPQHLSRGLLGSANQRIRLLTGRYHWRDFQNLPACEVILHPDGAITLTGIAPPSWPAPHYRIP